MMARNSHWIPHVTQPDFTAWRSKFAHEVVGDSQAISEALDVIRYVAPTDCTVMLTGETGTGKELFARAIHRASGRDDRAFIAVNCAAIPDNLIEAELFGHVKGAFTGATNPRLGRFMAAHEGTLFLDEVGDMPLAAQAKLLRVLEERMVQPVGSDSELPIDVRVIAATHHNLEELVAQGKFRADLYFRLAVVPVALPPLRDREDDIMTIAHQYVKRFSARLGRPVQGFDASARRLLCSHHWPGNVRELAHVIERAVLLSRKTMLSDTDLQLGSARPRLARPSEDSVLVPKPSQLDLGELNEQSLDLRTALENVERLLIERALKQAGGNRTEAAALLGLNRTTLVEKLRKYAA